MKYEITQEDKDVMTRDMNLDRTLKHLRNLSFYKFTVGDVLVREEKYRKHDGSGQHEWKSVTAACGLNNKYVYVFENELGIGYIRRLSVNGRKFVENPICVTNFDPDQTRFVLDPEYADHMLLASENDEFDAKSRYDTLKKKRERVKRMNIKLAIKLDTSNEQKVVDWMKSLKPGDILWYGYGFSSINKDPLIVQSGAEGVQSWGYKASNYTLTCIDKDNPSGYPIVFKSNCIDQYCFFTTRPHFADEVLD